MRLPAPFDRAFVLALIGMGTAVALALAVRGIAPQYGLTGLFAVPMLIGAGFLAPRLAGITALLCGVLLIKGIRP